MFLIILLLGNIEFLVHFLVCFISVATWVVSNTLENCQYRISLGNIGAVGININCKLRLLTQNPHGG